MPVQRGGLNIQATGHGTHLQLFETLLVQQCKRHVDDLAFMNFHKRRVPVAPVRTYYVRNAWFVGGPVKLAHTSASGVQLRQPAPNGSRADQEPAI